MILRNKSGLIHCRFFLSTQFGSDRLISIKNLNNLDAAQQSQECGMGFVS